MKAMRWFAAEAVNISSQAQTAQQGHAAVHMWDYLSWDWLAAGLVIGHIASSKMLSLADEVRGGKLHRWVPSKQMHHREESTVRLIYSQDHHPAHAQQSSRAAWQEKGFRKGLCHKPLLQGWMEVSGQLTRRTEYHFWLNPNTLTIFFSSTVLSTQLKTKSRLPNLTFFLIMLASEMHVQCSVLFLSSSHIATW